MTELLMRKSILAVAALFLASPSATQPAAAPPRLLIVISIDQFSADLFDEYRPQFTGGLARLGSGTLFRNGYEGHATTETCPGHSTILTGDRPARTGIVTNAWFDPRAPRADKDIYCAEDERVRGSSSANYTASPLHLRVPTLGELLKRASPASLNVAVAGKDRAAMMMGGHVADQRWFPKGAAFATDLAGAQVPKSVTGINAAVRRALAEPSPGLQPPPFCAAKAQPVRLMQKPGKTVGNGRFARAAGDEAGFKVSPAFDGAVLALAAGLVRELGLGSGAAPDILSIGLSATDYVGHSYGTGGQEMCLQLLSLDRDLGDFLGRLDGWGVDYAVVLTADHGGLDVPERLRAKGIAGAAWVDPDLSVSRLGPEIAARTGLKGPVVVAGGPSADVYLDPALQGADRERAIDALLAFYRAHPQVDSVFTKAEIARTPPPTGPVDRWSVVERVRASFDAERSGDLYVVLKPHITPIADITRYVATHGSPWDYDRRVPIMFWRAGMQSSTREEAVETVDIMPTLAAELGLPLASGAVDGACLAGIPGIACPAH
jgi:arylsulfatase A-like enzyme